MGTSNLAFGFGHCWTNYMIISCGANFSGILGFVYLGTGAALDILGHKARTKNVCVYVCVYVFMYVYVYIYVCVYVYVHVHMCVCLCMCVCVCV